MLLVAAFLGTTVSAATTYYYLNPNDDYLAEPYVQPLTNGVHWTTKADGSGKVAAEGNLSNASNFVMGCGTAIGPSNTVQVLTNLASSAKYLHVGDKTATPWTPAALVLEMCSKDYLTLGKYAYLSKGLMYFNKGVTQYAKGSDSITVYSPASDPFRVAFGTNSCTAGWACKVKGAEDTGVLVGGSSEFCADASRQTGNTFYLSVSSPNFYGTITVTNENLTIPSFSTRPLTMKLRYSLAAGRIVLCDYTAFTYYGATSHINVRDLTLGNQVLLNVPVSETDNASLSVTNELTIAEGAKVQVYLALAVAARIHGTRRLTLLTAPDTSTFSADDFELVGYEVSGLAQLSVETDEEAHTRSLVCTYTYAPDDTIFALETDSTSYKNAETYQSIVTNASAWSDGRVVHSEGDYFVRGYAAKTVVLRTPQAAWEDGSGNTGADFTFPGKSLTVASGGQLMPGGARVTFDDLRLLNGSIVAQPNITRVSFNGSISVDGATSFRIYKSKIMNLNASISGDGQVSFDGWASYDGPGTVYLNGDNAAFGGTMKVSSNRESPSSSTNQRLYAGSGGSFGKALDAYEPAALLLEKWGQVEITNDVTLAANRGVTVNGNAVFNVAAGKTFKADGLTLRGSGTCKLSGTFEFGQVVSAEGASLALSVTANSTLTLHQTADASDSLGMDLRGAASLTLASKKTLALAATLTNPTYRHRTVSNAVVTASAEVAGTIRSKGWVVSTPIAGYENGRIVEVTNADGSVTFFDVQTRDKAHTPGTMLLVGDK